MEHILHTEKETDLPRTCKESTHHSEASKLEVS
jgi:hypothetical protein